MRNTASLHGNLLNFTGKNRIRKLHDQIITMQIFACTKSTIETLEKGRKYVQS